MKFRIEKDTMGDMKVPVDAYWAAQTQRSLENFKIGWEKMPVSLIHAFAVLKRSVAVVNNRLGKLHDDKSGAIVRACDEIISDAYCGGDCSGGRACPCNRESEGYSA